MNNTTRLAYIKQSPRRFTGESPTGFGDLAVPPSTEKRQPPTTTHAQLNGQTVTIEHHPETAHLGRRFLAFFEAGGISAWGRCETGAIDALEEAVADELADREACAAFDAPNTKSFG